MSKTFPSSYQLFAGYLHQDWPDEFDSYVAAVQAMIESGPEEEIAEAAGELRTLLSMGRSEKELEEILFVEMGCYFDPASSGKTYQEWLEEVLEQWEKALSKK